MKKENRERVEELIRENKTLKETNDVLEKESGGHISSAAFYKRKQSINPTQKVAEALEGSKIRRVERVEKQKVEKRKLKWSTQKQKQADESQLAKLVNEGIFHATLPFCKSKQLKKEDVEEINVGGSAVACVLFFFPDIDLNHPTLVLVTRIVLFYIKFKAICSVMKEKIEIAKDKLSGLKSNWGEGK